MALVYNLSRLCIHHTTTINNRIHAYELGRVKLFFTQYQNTYVVVLGYSALVLSCGTSRLLWRRGRVFA